MAQALGDDFPWNRPLRYRQGSPERLEGIDLYYDFGWREIFPDWRAQFQNGRCLARLVKRDTPKGKTPALLLTTQEVQQRPIETNTHYVVVVNLPRYLKEATADAAVSYFARFLGSGITDAARLHDLASEPDVIDAVVKRGLNAEHIAAWAAANEDGIEQLRAIAGMADSSAPHADLPAVIAALQAVETLDPEIVAAIEALLGPDIDREARLRFIRALTADRTGRYVASEVLGQRLIDRLADLKVIAKEYSELLDDQSSGETALQNFIEQNPWLLGLDYVNTRPRRALPRGAMDFILERYDGFHDLLELKSPQDPIVDAPDEVDGVPPPAHAYALSDALAQALAQVHVYRDTLTSDAAAVERLYGLPGARDPRLIIVIGQVRNLPSHRSRVLRDLNLSLHRVEIVPYDLLVTRSLTALDNVERYLSASSKNDAAEQSAT
jgi:hypothetical protein